MSTEKQTPPTSSKQQESENIEIEQKTDCFVAETKINSENIAWHN